MFATRLEELLLDLRHWKNLPKCPSLVAEFYPAGRDTRVAFHEYSNGASSYCSASVMLNWIYVPVTGSDLELQNCLGGRRCYSTRKKILLYKNPDDPEGFWFGDGLADGKSTHLTLWDFLNRDSSRDVVKLERVSKAAPSIGWTFWSGAIVKR